MLKVTKVVVGILEENCYIAYNAETNSCVLVDPGDNSQGIIKVLEDIGSKPEAILITHGHFDHIGAISGLLKHYPDLSNSMYASSEEEPVFKRTNTLKAMEGRTLDLNEVKYLNDGTKLKLAGEIWRLMHTPGHSAGSSCYYVKDSNLLFSGDTLFKDSCGRTDLETGDQKAIINSIQNIIMTLPDDTLVLPGHGPNTTLGYERASNFIMHM